MILPLNSSTVSIIDSRKKSSTAINLTTNKKKKSDSHDLNSQLLQKRSVSIVSEGFATIQSIDHPKFTFLRRILTYYGLWRPNGNKKWLFYQLVYLALLCFMPVLCIICGFSDSISDRVTLFLQTDFIIPARFTSSPSAFIPSFIVDIVPVICYISLIIYFNHHLTWNLGLRKSQKSKIARIEAHAQNLKINARARYSAESRTRTHRYNNNSNNDSNSNNDNVDNIDTDFTNMDIDGNNSSDDDGYSGYTSNSSLDEGRLGVNARSGAANSHYSQIASRNGNVNNFNNKLNLLESGGFGGIYDNIRGSRASIPDNIANDDDDNDNNDDKNNDESNEKNINGESRNRFDKKRKKESHSNLNSTSNQNYDASVHFGILLNEIQILDAALCHDISQTQELKVGRRHSTTNFMSKKKFRKFQFKKRFFRKLRRGFLILITFEALLVLSLELFESIANKASDGTFTFSMALSHICYYIITFVHTSPIFLLCYILYLIGVIHKYQLRYIYYLIDFNHTLNLFQFKTIIREIHRTIVKTSKKFRLILIFNSIMPLIILMMIFLFDGNEEDGEQQPPGQDTTSSDDSKNDIWRDWHYLWLWFSLMLYLMASLFQLYICSGVTSACDELIVRIYHRQSITQSYMLNEAKSPKNSTMGHDIARKLSDVLGPGLNAKDYHDINFTTQNHLKQFNNNKSLNQMSSHPDIFFLVHYVKDMRMGWYLGAFRVDIQFVTKVIYALVALGVFLAVNYLSEQQQL